MEECPQWITEKFDRFMNLCDDNFAEHPYIVVILMHEYMRNLYPHDPYIIRETDKHPLGIAVEVLDRNIEILNLWSDVGSYRISFDDYKQLYNAHEDVKDKTGRVYGRLWDHYPGDMVDEAVNIIRERFSANSIPLDLIKGKVLDAGCGSGRYTCALALLGAQEVVGLDYGEDGLRLGRSLAEEKRLDSVVFQKGSLIDMPFEDEEFDFVFCNGVFHHTGDIEKSSRELHRVLKSGGYAWYFIYGDGGLYWYSRKKMNTFMKRIPQAYAMDVLRMIGMPMNRFIFCDNWYVPIEEHTSNDELIGLFRRIGFSEYKRAYNGRKTDFDYLVVQGDEKDQQLWGDGNLRYLIRK